MDPTTTFCPNMACPARGHTGRGNIGIHSRKHKRFLCTECHKTFSATTGTAFYRLRTAAETVSLVMTLLAHGCPVQAIVAAFGFDERTVTQWGVRSGRQGQAVHGHLVEQPRDLGQVQADEIRVKKQGGIVWMALAMMVKTRLWLHIPTDLVAKFQTIDIVEVIGALMGRRSSSQGCVATGNQGASCSR